MAGVPKLPAKGSWSWLRLGGKGGLGESRRRNAEFKAEFNVVEKSAIDTEKEAEAEFGILLFSLIQLRKDLSASMLNQL